MRRVCSHFAACCTAVGILISSACTTLPSLTPDEVLRIDDIVNRIQCETQLAFDTVREINPHAWSIVQGWVAGFSLRLIVEENLIVNPTVGLTGIPLTFGNFGGIASITGATTNRRTVNITFGFVLRQIDEIQCRSSTKSNLPLASNLGIPEWIVRSLEPFEDKRNVAQPTLIGSTLDFIVDTTGRVTPGINLISVSNSSYAYGGIFSGERRDTHTLEISIKPIT